MDGAITHAADDSRQRETFLEQFLTEAGSLPPETDSEWILRLTKLLERATTDDDEALRKVLSGGYPDSLRFAAYYMLVLYYRRMKSVTQIGATISSYGAEFEGHPLSKLVRAVHYKLRGGVDDIERSLELFEELIAEVPGNWPLLHGYAETVATATERGLSISSDTQERAYKAVRHAIEARPSYPKLYCTRGRLQAALGRYDEAKNSIMRAMDLENPKSMDFAIRVGDYQSYLTQVYTKSMVDELGVRADETTQAIDEMRSAVEVVIKEAQTQSITMVGFFAAIVSFTIGSLALASVQPAVEAAALIVILAGALILVYSVFTLFVTFDQAGRGRSAIGIAVGVATIVATYVFVIGV